MTIIWPSVAKLEKVAKIQKGLCTANFGKTFSEIATVWSIFMMTSFFLEKFALEQAKTRHL